MTHDPFLSLCRTLADSMQTEPTDWEWIGPHMSQRMFGITRTRAEAYAQRHGGVAQKMGSDCCDIDLQQP